MGKPRFSCWIQLVQISFVELSQKILKIPKPSNYIFFRKWGENVVLQIVMVIMTV